MKQKIKTSEIRNIIREEIQRFRILNEVKRKELLVVKIVDFSKDKDEPAYDVEIYKNGKFIQPGMEGVYSIDKHGKEGALSKAKAFAIKTIKKMI